METGCKGVHLLLKTTAYSIAIYSERVKCVAENGGTSIRVYSLYGWKTPAAAAIGTGFVFSWCPSWPPSPSPSLSWSSSLRCMYLVCICVYIWFIYLTLFTPNLVCGNQTGSFIRKIYFGATQFGWTHFIQGTDPIYTLLSLFYLPFSQTWLCLLEVLLNVLFL